MWAIIYATLSIATIMGASITNNSRISGVAWAIFLLWCVNVVLFGGLSGDTAPVLFLICGDFAMGMTLLITSKNTDDFSGNYQKAVGFWFVPMIAAHVIYLASGLGENTVMQDYWSLYVWWAFKYVLAILQLLTIFVWLIHDGYRNTDIHSDRSGFRSYFGSWLFWSRTSAGTKRLYNKKSLRG